jgi:hypothetical protein
MANNYREVMAEVDRRVAALVQKGLSEVDATSTVFRDDRELYAKYTKASAEAPERPTQAPRLDAAPTGLEREVLRKADVLITKSAGLSMAEAISEVFRDNPELYAKYAKGDTPAPTVPDRPQSSPPAPVTKAQTTAGLSAFIPTSLQAELMKSAAHVSPGNYVKGLAAIEAALVELRSRTPKQGAA